MSVMTLCAIDDDGTTIDYSFELQNWYSALNHFVKFLRAQGYALDNDSVLINTSNGHYVTEDDLIVLNNIEFINLDAVLFKE